MPGRGFKVADAYADFRVDVDSAIGDAAARLKAKGGEFAKMGEGAGKAFSAGFGRGLDLNKSLDRELEQVRKRTNMLERTGNQAGEGYARGFRQGVNLRPAMVEQLAVVKSAKPAFAREGKQAGDAYAKGFGGTRLAGPSVTGGGSGAEAAGEEMANATTRGFRKGSKGLDNETSKVAARTQAKFNALVFAGLSVGLPAAAAIGAAGVAAALTLPAIGFAALGISTAAATEKVSSAWVKTADTVTAKTQDMSTLFEDGLVRASGDVEASFTRMAPLIARGMSEAVPQVNTLVHSVTTAAEDALPGLVKAAASAGPAVEGLGNFAERAGAGVGDMFTNLAKGSVDAGAGMREFGGMTRELLGFTGQLLTNLAANHGELGVLNGMLHTAEGALLTATTAGSGFVGFLHGFGQAGSGAIGVASGLVNVLSALPPQVTSFGGSLTATSMILGKFGVDAGAGFEGLGAKIKAAKGPLDTFKTAASGLATGALNPAAIATLGLSVLLDELGRRQQEAAQKAQEHKEAVRTLTDALRQDGGVVGDNVKQTVAKSLADKDAAKNAHALGIGLDTVQASSLGNSVALETLKHHTDSMIDSWVKSGAINQKNGDYLKTNTDWLRQNGGAAKDVVNDYGNLSAAQQNALLSSENLNGAIGSQIAQAREATAVYEAQETGLNNLSTSELHLRDSALEAYNAVTQQNNAMLGLRGAVLNTQEATDNYNKTMKDHTATTRDKEKATLDLEKAQQAEINAAYQQGVANSSAATDTARMADGMTAANAEAVKLATSFAGPLPASLQASISKMSVTQAQAAGLKVEIDKTGQAVYRLPDGKVIKLTGDNQQALDAAAAVQNALNRLHDKTVTLTIAQRGKSPTGISPTGAPIYSAEGNLLTPRGGDGASHPARYFAGGGLAGSGLKPMASNVGTMVAPNTWRVVGDNMRFTELFAPLNGSQRTQDLIAQAAEHEGMVGAANELLGAARSGANIFEDLSFRGASANSHKYNDQLADTFYAAGTGGTVEDLMAWLPRFIAQSNAASQAATGRLVSQAVQITSSRRPAVINVAPPAGMDYEVLANKVSRILALRSK